MRISDKIKKFIVSTLAAGSLFAVSCGNNNSSYNRGDNNSSYNSFSECINSVSYPENRACWDVVYNGEVRKQENKTISIGPNEFNKLIEFTVKDNNICISNVSNYLGIDFPFEHLVERTEVLEPRRGYSFEFGIVRQSGYKDLEGLNDNVEAFSNENLEGRCNNIHEVTHVFLSNTTIPRIFNEGIATYMEDKSRGDSARMMGFNDYTCDVGGFFDNVDTESQPTGFHPYSNLSDIDAINDWAGYVSAGCFWDYVAQNYGQDSIKAIIAKVTAERKQEYDSREFNARFIPDFINRFVVPETGEEIKSVLRERFGINVE